MSTATITKNIPVARPFIGREEEAAVLEVLRSGWVSQGPKVAEFEKRFAEYVGAEHAIAVSSCTTALHMALMAAGIKAGDEVLCPSLSFIATANSIRYVGATPIFVDVDPFTYNMDPAKVEAAITPKTRGILLVHQIGLPSDIAAISKIAKRHGLIVVEDAACAIGSEYDGRRIGMPHTLMACFSFHPRKILTTGEGGMITTADPKIADRLRKMRQHAMSVSDLARHSSSKIVSESYPEVGYNYRMTDLQAALGLVQLQRLDEMIERRRRLAMRYSEALSGIDWLVPPVEPVGYRHNFQSYMVRLTSDAPISRDELMQELLNHGISSRRGIMATHRELPYSDARWANELKETESVTDNCIILPIYHTMAEEDQDFVIDSISEISSAHESKA
ncbi:MAG TPA: DegT/DnrJ/EryC1/StrS family aminotransferase [Candidatus Sulfotelmatobacter sp.]|nr:DegT/DnrJ/EryC1/StrS family aminotransferase [Candidatus Sulfotelmatobacter sp.]